MSKDSPKIPGYASFRDDEAEPLKLSVDLGGSPVWVVFLSVDKTSWWFAISGLRSGAFGRERPKLPVHGWR